MLERQQAQELSQRVLKRVGEDQAEVVLIFKEHALTRFANNAIHQNVSEVNLTLYLRLLHGKRLGLASSNRQDSAALDELVARAQTNARASSEDLNHPGLIKPKEYSSLDCFDESTAAYSPQERADQVGIVCRLAQEKGLNASGAFSTGTSGTSVANTNGVFAYHALTDADFQTTVMSEDSSGRAQASAWRVSELDLESIGLKAVQKAERGCSPRDIKPTEYPVVLDPYVTDDLLHMLNLYGMGGQTVLDGRSWMNNRIGEIAMSPTVNIWDDGLDSGGMPMPFDAEGVPKKKVDLVLEGKVKGPVYDRNTAKKAGGESTGHAMPPYFPPYMRVIGPIGLNLFMSPGEASLEEMIASTERGLYITRFWYTRLVHPSDCIITGMTRDGVFMIENGEIAYPVKNLRFTQSYLDALNNVELIGSETLLLKSEFGSHATRVPALKLSSFNFTGVTV